MSQKLTDSARLRSIMDRLMKQKSAAPLAPEEREALAECTFRLAVAPETSPPEAVRLLLRGLRLDGANPRYAYHLARIYLQHGDLDRAATWLQRAIAQCPTSHRIWAHVSLLQRELHARYHGDARYDVEKFRERGESVEKAIHGGIDHLASDLSDFTPPMSEKLREEEKNRQMERALQDPFAEPTPTGEPTPAPATPARAVPSLPRIENPGKCRWSGIDDLLVEALLESEPSKNKLEGLLPLLERAATVATTRPRGTSAFVILAIQWLVSGYPVATIRRLMSKIPAGPRPDLSLLGRVCAIFEASDEDVPKRLAEAVQTGRLPPFLTALIHQRRLVWFPLRFKTLNDYRSARRYLNSARRSPPKDEPAQKAQDEEVAAHLKKLRQGVKDLYPPAPRQLADQPPKEPTPAAAAAATTTAPVASPAERLAALETQAREMKARFDADWLRLRDLETAHNAGALDEKSIGELQAMAAHAEAGKAVCTEALAEIEQLRKAGALTAEQAGHAEKVDRVIKDNAKRPGNFLKNLIKFNLPKSAPAPAATTAAGPVPASATATASPAATPGKTLRQPQIGDDSLKGLAGLEKALDDTDRELIAFYNAATATFKPYSRSVLRQPALHGLRGLIRARAAETFFRLGRRQLARRLWNSLLCLDRLDVDLLRNIAVCDTRDQDAIRCLSSWQAYVEMLYFYDIVEGSPRPRAAARAEFHREFGNAFAPAFLQEKPEAKRDEKADEAAFAIFLDSPGRLRHFVGHKLLELLNGKLDFRSPLWVLGVRKSDGPKARERARDGLVTFVEATCSLLPERVREGFKALCLNHIDASAKACGSAQRLTPEKDPHYANEEDRHVHWLKEVVKFKKTIYIHIRTNETLYRHLRSLDFLDEFARLDAVPIDQSPDLLNAAALANGLSDGAVVLDLMGGLTDHVLFPMLQFVFKDTDMAEDRPFRQAQYDRLTGPWATNAALNLPREAIGDRSYLDLIDEPSAFYPVEITAAFNGETTPRAIELLREWVARYPRSTGPARHLAQLLAHGPKQSQAIELANAGDPACVPMLIDLVEEGANAEALEALENAGQVGLTPAGRKDCWKIWNQLQGQTLTTVNNAIIIFQNLSAKATLNPGRLSRAVKRWLEDWRRKLAAWDAEVYGEAPITPENLTEVENSLDSAVVHAALRPLGDLDKNWRGVVTAMTRILSESPTSLTALYYRMIAWHRLAVEASQSNKRDEVLRCLRESRSDAQALLKRSTDEDHRKQATDLLAEINKIPGV